MGKRIDVVAELSKLSDREILQMINKAKLVHLELEKSDVIIERDSSSVLVSRERFFDNVSLRLNDYAIIEKNGSSLNYENNPIVLARRSNRWAYELRKRVDNPEEYDENRKDYYEGLKKSEMNRKIEGFLSSLEQIEKDYSQFNEGGDTQENASIDYLISYIKKKNQNKDGYEM